MISKHEFVSLLCRVFLRLIFASFYTWPMKWTFVAFVASLLSGYYVYDEFDPGTLCCDIAEYFIVYLYQCYYNLLGRSKNKRQVGKYQIHCISINANLIWICIHLRYSMWQRHLIIVCTILNVLSWSSTYILIDIPICVLHLFIFVAKWLIYRNGSVVFVFFFKNCYCSHCCYVHSLHLS